MVAINILGDINNNINKKLVIDNVKLVSSVYTLKQAINSKIINNSIYKKYKNNYFLIYNGIKLNDDKPLIEYGIKDNSNIKLHYNLNGGGFISDILSFILPYLLLILAFLVYALLLASGFLALISKIYGYSTTVLIKTITNYVLYFFGVKSDKMNTVYTLFTYMMKYLSLGLLIFILTYYLVYFLYYLISSKGEKKRVLYSWSISRGVTIIYLIFYLIYRLPDIIINSTLPMVDKLKKPFNFIKAPLILGKRSYDDIKFTPLYPIFGFYYQFIGKLLNSYKVFRKYLTTDNGLYYKCGKDNDITQLIVSTVDNIDISKFKYDMGKVTNKTISTKNIDKIPGMNKNDKDTIKKNIPKMTKLDSKIIKNYFDDILLILGIDKDDPIDRLYIKAIKYIVCQLLDIYSIFDKSIKKIGTIREIEDMILSSSVAGTIALISLFLALIIYLLFY